MALTYGSLFVGLGILWVPLALGLIWKSETTDKILRVVCWCTAGWLSSFAMLLAWAAVES